MMEYILYLLPLVFIQIGLAIWALIDLFKNNRSTKGSRMLWVVIIVAVNTIGPILYFLFGRDE